jgi:hypothetical protein
MRKDKLLKEWYDFNIKYWKALKLRAKLHGHLENSEALPQHIFNESEPIFVLSTGRVGTMLLTRLFELEKGLHIEHEALPEMLLTSKTAYVTHDISFAKGAFLAGRYEAIRDYQLSGLRYVETNNRLTFFAPAIAELFPKAKFIHLVRHPSSFISSGMQRKWYTGQSITDEGRISPPESLNLMSRSDKIAWLWNTTNEYIENFKRSISVERVYTLQSEKLFTNVDEAISLMKWLKFQTQPDLAKKIIDTPVNKSKTKKKYHSYDKSLTPLSKLYYPESD